jgi:hypothetical protein
MATKGKTEKELWAALGHLDDDLLNPDLPEVAVDDELKALGIEPDALSRRGAALATNVKEQERLSWQARAQEGRSHLEAAAAEAKVRVPSTMNRQDILARLDDLRTRDSKIGTAIKMAARKRKSEESTDEELRALLEEMEALRAIEGSGKE